MVEQRMDVRSSVALLRRRWRLLATVGAAGVVVGGLYVAVVPVQLSSTSLVLLPSAEGSSTDTADNGLATQVRIVLSAPVLQRAGAAVSPSLSPARVNEQISVDAPTAQLIEIKAFSSRSDQARALSQGVANSYVAAIRNNADNISSSTVSDLKSREAALLGQLNALQTEIQDVSNRQRGVDSNSPDGRREGQLLAQLTADQANISVQLDKVKQTITDSGALDSVSAQATIIQPASPPVGPGLLQRLLTSCLEVGLLATVLAAGILLVKMRRDPRVRTRDDLADAVGSIVMADGRSRSRRSVAEWTALFETYEASAVEVWAFRQVLRSSVAAAASRGLLPPGAKRTAGRVEHPRSLALVCFSDDREALAVGPQLAVFTASLGIATAFSVTSGLEGAASLWAACAHDRNARRLPHLRLTARATGLGSERTQSGPGTGVDAGGPAPGTPRRTSVSRRTAVWGRRTATDHPLPGAHAQASGGAPLPPGGAESALTGGRIAGESALPVSAEEPGAALPERGPLGEELRDADDPTAEMTIVLTVADRQRPTFRDVPPTAVTVLVVAPGVADREDLARLAVALDDSGRKIDGIIVANPDPFDRTTGRRTMEERARQVPLPVRTTGVSQVALAATDGGKGC